jgi:hypothetical protein
MLLSLPSRTRNQLFFATNLPPYATLFLAPSLPVTLRLPLPPASPLSLNPFTSFPPLPVTPRSESLPRTHHTTAFAGSRLPSPPLPSPQARRRVASVASPPRAAHASYVTLRRERPRRCQAAARHSDAADRTPAAAARPAPGCGGRAGTVRPASRPPPPAGGRWEDSDGKGVHPPSPPRSGAHRRGRGVMGGSGSRQFHSNDLLDQVFHQLECVELATADSEVSDVSDEEAW